MLKEIKDLNKWEELHVHKLKGSSLLQLQYFPK